MPANNIINNIATSLEKLVTLQINTTVVDGSSEETMSSSIDLLQGDISNTIPKSFVTGDLAELRTFHQSQVDKGHQIIKENIETLQAMYELFRKGREDFQ